jgi:hypothetical protein
MSKLFRKEQQAHTSPSMGEVDSSAAKKRVGVLSFHTFPRKSGGTPKAVSNVRFARISVDTTTGSVIDAPRHSIGTGERTMRTMLCMAALGAMLAVAGTAQAQVKSKVIDTNSLVVKPVDTTTNLVGRTFQYFSRVTADAIDNSQIIRTVNNLFGNNKTPATQSGISPLPDPSRYPSNYYNSPIKPVMPKYQTLPNK